MNNHKGKIAISEMSILIMGIVAFTCLIGNIPFISSISEGSGGFVAAGGAAAGTLGTLGGGTGIIAGSYTSSVTASTYSIGGWSGGGAAFAVALFWAVAAYYIAMALGPGLGMNEEETEAFAWAASAATFTGVALTSSTAFTGTAAAGGTTASAATLTAASVFVIVLVVVVIVYFIALALADKSYKVVTFSCNAWNAQEGGENCELCNNQEIPCSEYQCRSLGQACEIINKGTTEEQCFWISQNDILPPVIEPSRIELSDDFDYTPDQAVSPPDRGVQIVNTLTTDRCIPAFTPLSFGIELDEPAKCKVDPLRKNSYANMSLFLSNGMNRYNHTISFSLPGVANLEQEGLGLENGGNFELYVRCSDANGNENTADFVFKYCVDAGPDTTAPQVRSSNVLNNMPIAVGRDSLDVIFYINEPSECKWSHQNEIYDNMPEGMICANSFEEATEFNSEMVFPCATTLTGIQEKQDNKFYIKCKDQPAFAGTDRESDRNANAESYEYVVIGTRELVLEEAGPNGTTIKDAAQDVKVTLTAKTSAGFNEGQSTCYYAEKGEDDYVAFFNTHSYIHSTDLYLAEGDYEFNIKCIDLGGNADSATIEFEAESDSESPLIVRAYKSDNSLQLITDEAAECVYSTTTCNYLFEDGIYMMTSGEINHFTEWNTRTKLHIKCRDMHGNEPSQSECSSIIRPIN